MRIQKGFLLGVAVLAVALSALAWSGPAAASTVVNVNDRLPVTLVLDNPCTPAVEAISLSGEFHARGQVVFNADGTTHVDLFVNSHLSGADALTGVKYVSNDQVRVQARYPAGALLTFVARFLVVSQTGIDNFFLRIQFRIGPDGRVFFDRIVDTECRG